MMPAPKFPSYKTVPTASLIPYVRNARTHSPAQVDKIAASIREFGFLNPIITDGQNGIVAGHGRVMAAQKLGLDTLPTIDAAHLTEAQRRAYVLADNRMALDAGWDNDLLKIELQDLEAAGFDLTLTGFDLGEVAALTLDATEGLTDPDAVPDAPAVPVTVLGDVWLLGRHRLMCGDSTSIDAVERLMDGVTPNAVITDPPYGIGIDGQKKSVSANPKHNRKFHEKRGWDNERPNASIFAWIVALGVPSVIWGGNYFADLLPATRGWIYWSKGQDGLTMSDGELAWTTEDKPLRSKTVNRGALRGSVHPTQKPAEVIDFSVDFLSVPIKGAILDVFAGSGTVCIVCENTDRRAFMMELDPKYCDVIIQRWQNFTGQTATLEATGQPFTPCQP
jgi:DNA modification methylase